MVTDQHEGATAPDIADDRKVYTSAQTDMAKAMFMNYKTYNEIANATGINPYTVRQKCGKWKKERDVQKYEVLKALVDHKKQFFVDLTTSGLELLVRNIKDLNNEKATLSVKELASISDIITNIDKIIRLDDGTATEIVTEIKPATREQIVELVRNDPFTDIEDFEFKEIADSSESVGSEDEAPDLEKS
jgi:hypothetical protein